MLQGNKDTAQRIVNAHIAFSETLQRCGNLTVHDFMGQTVFNHDVIDTTIAIGMCRLYNKPSVAEALACTP